MKDTKIEWASSTWNPVSGCDIISSGCKNCYAKELAERFRGGPAYPNGFEVTLKPHRLREPKKWKGSLRIFVNSMSDCFHEGIPTEYLQQMWAVMKECPQHQFLVLTKRALRMHALFDDKLLPVLPNVWLGVTVEDLAKPTLERLEFLAATEAAVRFVSAEPLLSEWMTVADSDSRLSPTLKKLDWVIFGGESGKGARPMDLAWIRDGISVCTNYGIAPFVKQLGSVWAGSPWDKGGDWDKWPAEYSDLKVREYPTPRTMVAEGALF